MIQEIKIDDSRYVGFGSWHVEIVKKINEIIRTINYILKKMEEKDG